jgi:hypothetical protein
MRTPEELEVEIAAMDLELLRLDEQEREAELGITAEALLARRGDEKAQARLNSHEAARASAQHRLPRLRAARDAAATELRAVLRVAEQEAELQKARRAKELIRKARQRGSDLDRELRSVVENYLEVEADLSSLADTSGKRTNRDLVKINVERALRAGLMRIPALRLIVPPNERCSFSQLINGWTANADRWADEILNSSDIKQPRNEVSPIEERKSA